MTSDLEVRRLAKHLVKLQRQVDSLNREHRLSNASIEDAGVDEYDIDGQVVSRIGKQYDGTHTAVSLGGPPPPTPGDFEILAQGDTAFLRWAGAWADGPTTVAPMDFSRVEAHIGEDPNLSGLLFTTLRGTFESPRGGELQIRGLPVDVDLYARLTARSQSGKFSLASDVVGPFQVHALTAADVGIDLSTIGGNKIHRGAEEPEGEHRIGDLWLAEVSPGDPAADPPVPPQNETRQWDGDEWNPVVSQRVTQALEDAFEAQQSAGAANIAALGAQDAAEAAANVAAGKTTTIQSDVEPPHVARVVGDEWIETDNDNLRHVWDGAAYVPAPIGNGAIEPQSLVLSELAVTGSVSAALLEAILVLATTIIAGDPNAHHARMDEQGFRAFRPGPDGVPIEATRLGGPGSDVLTVTGSDGKPKFYADTEGKATAQSIYTQQVFRGGRELQEMLDDLPRGILQRGILEGPSARTTTEIGVLEIGATLLPGRLYEVWSSPLRILNDTPPFEAVTRVRWNASGGAVGVSSGLFQEMVARPASSLGELSQHRRTIVGDVAAPAAHRFLLSLAKVAGSGDCYMWGAAGYPIEFVIEDKGRWRPQGGVINTGVGAGTQPKQTYEKQYTCTWTQTIRGSGTVRADTTDAVQGQAPSDSFNGNQGAMLGFPDWSADLAGATVNAITLFMYANHFYNDAGGPAYIGYHGAANPPGAMAGAFNQTTANFPKVGGAAKNLTDWAPLAKNGTFKGITLGRPPAGQDNYGRFAGAGTANPPVIVINYTK